MSFFQHSAHSPDSSFTPLFRLLDDFENFSHHHGRRFGLSHWQPKFDVCETDAAFELHGELPGMNKDDVSIEFTEPQTMVIRGKVERSYETGRRGAGRIEGATMSGAITEGEEEQQQQQQPKTSGARKATVEDEPEAAAPTGAAGEVSEKAPKQPEETSKYWLSERRVGEFTRTFSFPARVNHDDVTASFADGILAITVPKEKRHEARFITIS